MTDPAYPAPPRPTLDDLDPESATTDRLVAMARSHREGEEYPTAEVLLANLPVMFGSPGPTPARVLIQLRPHSDRYIRRG